MPTLLLRGGHAGQFGPITTAPWRFALWTNRMASWTGMCSVMTTMRRTPASSASFTGPGRELPWDQHDARVGARRGHGPLGVVEHGHARGPPGPLAGAGAAHDMRPEVQHCLGVVAALGAGDALHDDLVPWSTRMAISSTSLESRRPSSPPPGGSCGDEPGVLEDGARELLVPSPDARDHGHVDALADEHVAHGHRDRVALVMPRRC